MNEEINLSLPSIGQISNTTVPLVAPALNAADALTGMHEEAVAEVRKDFDDQVPQPQPSDVTPAEILFSALWRNPDQNHFLGTRDRKTGKFHNQPVPGTIQAVTFAQASSTMGLDVFFACAEYATPDGRTSQNATGAWSFWADIDCGPDKAATGKGYATEKEAKAALHAFCAKAKFPASTHIVNSGSGIHAYWVFDKFLDRDLWQTYATKLKGLMKAHGFLADPSRTADIASVLRVHGTLNQKYEPPKSVTLEFAAEAYLPLAEMLDALDAAFVDVKEEVKTPEPTHKADPVTPMPISDTSLTDPPNLHHLKSALKSLDPDCDERTWKFHRLAPLAYLVREFPELGDTLRALAIAWSSGELRGVPSTKWHTPGSNGLTGAQFFDRVWKRFLTDNYQGKRVTVGTIFFHAEKAGWVFTPGQAGSTGFEVVAAV